MHHQWAAELGQKTPLLLEKPELPQYLVPYEQAFVRLSQGGLENGFTMQDIKIAYDIFPIGPIGFFFDAMFSMRTALLGLSHEKREETET